MGQFLDRQDYAYEAIVSADGTDGTRDIGGWRLRRKTNAFQ